MSTASTKERGRTNGPVTPTTTKPKARKAKPRAEFDIAAEAAESQAIVDASGLPPLLVGIWEGERLHRVSELSDPRAGFCHSFNRHDTKLKAAPFDPHSDLAEQCPAENSIPEGWKLSAELAMRKQLPHSEDTPERLGSFERAQAVAESTWSPAKEARLQQCMTEVERLLAQQAGQPAA